MAGAVLFERRCGTTREFPLLRRRAATGIAALVLALLSPGAAPGQEPGAIGTLSDEEVERRYRFIEERLDSHRTRAQIWHWSWTAINGGAAIGLGIAGGLASSTEDRVSLFSQAALAGVGVADLYLLRPLPARDGAAPLRKLPASTPAERRARLAQAELLLRRAAGRPGGWRDWWPHLANLLVNTAVGIAVWQTGTTEDALIVGISGAAVGEVYIFSQPQGWVEDLEAYERMTTPGAHPGGRWSLVPSSGGIAVRYEF